MVFQKNLVIFYRLVKFFLKNNFMELHTLSIAESRKGLDAGDFSSVDLTRACLDRIKERNPEINAFITVTEDIAYREAEEADKRIARGEIELLTGIPFGAKDAICIKGVRSTGAAKILDNYNSGHESTVITKIRKQGAVLLGKQNCDTFGHGASNENSMYGAVKNPSDFTKVSGGSSGGSAAALSDNQCIFSIGEDTGGSIRQPASFCGVVGLRPSYGRNSRYGIMALASSLDVVGPLTKTVEDTALVMQVIAGPDPKDATTVPDAVPDYCAALKKGVAGLTVGIPREYFLEGGALDAEVRERIYEHISILKSRGCNIVEVSLPHTRYAIATYYVLVSSEDSSNLARFDGIRYGVQSERGSLYKTYSDSRADGFPAEVKRRVLMGTYALSAGYYDAYYTKAQKVRTCIINDFTDAFSHVDVLVAPTSPFTAFGIGDKHQDPLSMYLADLYVSAASLAGIPSLSVPVGVASNGLPIGLQVMGPRLSEDVVLQVGDSIFNNQ